MDSVTEEKARGGYYAKQVADVRRQSRMVKDHVQLLQKKSNKIQDQIKEYFQGGEDQYDTVARKSEVLTAETAPMDLDPAFRNKRERGLFGKHDYAEYREKQYAKLKNSGRKRQPVERPKTSVQFKAGFGDDTSSANSEEDKKRFKTGRRNLAAPISI